MCDCTKCSCDNYTCECCEACCGPAQAGGVDVSTLITSLFLVGVTLGIAIFFLKNEKARKQAKVMAKAVQRHGEKAAQEGRKFATAAGEKAKEKLPKK